MNIVLNCAANVELDTKIDVAVRVNVTGPLLLLKLAQESPNICCFLQVSSSFANSDRKGFIEERMYESGIDWPANYKKILNIN